MADIKRLLRKKGWTGKELGQIEISNMCHMWSQQMQGKTPTPLVEHEDFMKMLNSINDPVQGKVYNDYLKIHKWLNIAYNITSGQEQQAQSNIKTLLNYIEVSQAVEDTYAYIDKLPVIMTEKQYNDFAEKRKKEILNIELGFNLFNMFEHALTALVNQLEKNPRKANPLKSLKPKLEKELVKDPRILSRYNEVMGYGYRTIDETGERSDQMTDEEWKKAIDSSGLMDAIKSNSGVIIPTAASRTIEIAKATFNGATEEEIKNIEGKYKLTKPTTFHLYDNPPEDLNRWEILATGDLFEYYRSLESVDQNGKELSNDEYDQAVTDDILAFKKEFPKVFEAVLKDMRKYIGDKVDTPIEKWAETVFMWNDLSELNYYDFNDTYLDDLSLFDGNGRAIFNGVAILKEGEFNKHHLDERGYYKAPDVLCSIKTLSLEAFFTDSPDYADKAEGIEIARENLIDSYYFMIGFNKALELIADHFDIPMLDVFKFDSDLMADRIDAFDSLAAMLYKTIKDRNYEDKELQKKKLEVLRNFFAPIDCKKIVIPQATIEEAKKSLNDSNIFNDSNLTQLLCLRN